MQKLQKWTSATSKSRVRAADVADAVDGAGSDLENGEDTEHPPHPIPARVAENAKAPETNVSYIEKQGQGCRCRRCRRRRGRGGAGSDLENGKDTEHPQYPIPARVVENKTAPEIEKQGQLRESYVTSESGTSIVKSSRFSVLPVQIT